MIPGALRMRRLKILLFVTACAAILSGCASLAPMNANAELTQGPEPERVASPQQDVLACVGSALTRQQRQRGFGIIDVPDKTGRVNFNGNDAMGYFNTQGAADMLVTSFMRTGVRVVEISPAHRNYAEWQLKVSGAGMVGDGTRRDVTDAATGKTESIRHIPVVKGSILPIRYAIYGAITSTDPIPGGGVKGGAYGAAVGYNQNRMLTRIDLRAVRMPVGEEVHGEVVAFASIKKQIVQDQVVLELTRFFGPAAASTLVTFDAGLLRREPMQYSTGEMLDIAAADLLSQIFKVRQCDLGTPSHVAVAGK